MSTANTFTFDHAITQPKVGIKPLDLSVIVPTRNEAGNIELLLTRIQNAFADGGSDEASLEVIFVDDSTDDTPNVVQAVARNFRDLHVRLIHRPPEKRVDGLGGAVRTGLAATQSKYACVMDGDLQHPPEMVPVLLPTAEEQQADLVVATRRSNSSEVLGLSAARNLIPRGLDLIARIFFPRELRGVSDPLTGFFLVRVKALALHAMQHINMMQYANIQAGIASWWGQGQQTDTKVPGLLTAAAGTSFRWALYYENESPGDPSVAQIQNDLTYIRDHYGNDPSFLRVNGKFVVFVYSDGNDACGMADRWKQANTVGAYVVLKVFSGYRNCASQPDSWHQYSPAVAADQQGTYSYSISPGFWLKGQSVRLARDLSRWQQNVRDMVASGASWQLVTTFSEWGEGIIVEPALEWPSASGYGQYLDALHYNGNMP